MNSLLVLHLEFLQVDVTRGFRCLSRTREQQHAFNCPCAGLWMPVIPYRDSVGFARFSDLIFCIEFRIAFQAAELMATSQLAELIWESPGPWRWIQTFLPSKKISFYIVSYFLPNLACSRPLGTHTHTHTCAHSHRYHPLLQVPTFAFAKTCRFSRIVGAGEGLFEYGNRWGTGAVSQTMRFRLSLWLMTVESQLSEFGSRRHKCSECFADFERQGTASVEPHPIESYVIPSLLYCQ